MTTSADHSRRARRLAETGIRQLAAGKPGAAVSRFIRAAAYSMLAYRLVEPEFADWKRLDCMTSEAACRGEIFASLELDRPDESVTRAGDAPEVARTS